MSVNIPPTNSIGYNYAIARALFETSYNKKIIEDEITKIIFLQNWNRDFDKNFAV